MMVWWPKLVANNLKIIKYFWIWLKTDKIIIVLNFLHSVILITNLNDRRNYQSLLHRMIVFTLPLLPTLEDHPTPPPPHKKKTTEDFTECGNLTTWWTVTKPRVLYVRFKTNSLPSQQMFYNTSNNSNAAPSKEQARSGLISRYCATSTYRMILIYSFNILTFNWVSANTYTTNSFV